MDRSRYKRQETQSFLHTNKKNLGNSASVPKATSARPIVQRQFTPRRTAPVISGAASVAPPVQKMRPATASMEGFRPRRMAPAAAATSVNAAVQDFTAQAAPVFSQVLEPVAAPSQPAEPAFQATLPEPPKRQYGLPPIDMDLPGEDSPSVLKGFKSRKTRRVAFRIVAVGLVLLITTGGLLASQTFNKSNKVFRGSAGTAAALKKQVDPNLLDGEGSGLITVLVLGRGGGAHSAPDLTDSLMLASIDPVNHKSTLFSIPRDLWVTVPGSGVMKLNAAWESGVFKYQGNGHTGTTDPLAVKAGFKAVDETIGEALGIKINYNVVLNFDAFKQAIDTVNGVSVGVPSDLVDETMKWENGNDPVLARAGLQTMDSKKALIYVRSRETSSDFARSQRQRSVMLALKQKLVSAGTLSNPLKISGLLNAFGNNVQTDLSLKNAARLYEITKDINDTNTNSIDLATGPTPLVTTGNMNGQSVVLPKAGLFKYDAIKAFLRSQLKDPYILKENARIVVLNGSTTPGVATTTTNDLKGYGYNIVGTANTPTSGWTTTTIVDLSKGKDKYTRHFLEQHYGVTARTTMPDDTIAATNRADFVIIIGSDKANSPQTETR